MPKKASKIDAQQNQKISLLEEKLKRAMADYVNLQKRVESQKQLLSLLAAGSILTKMIEILDDLYLSYHHLKDRGLKMIIDKFLSVLKSEGVQEIKAEGQQFDPKTMDCVNVAPGRQDFVVKVQKRGYTLNGQVLRPTQVVVGTSAKISQSKIKN